MSSSRISWGKMLKIINLMSMIVMVQYITRWPYELMVWGSTPTWGNFFFGCVFLKTYFRFLADLNYTIRLIMLSFLNQLIHKLAIGPPWFFSNFLTSLMSEKNFLIYKIIISTQHLILVRYSWTVQIQGTVAVDSSSRNLHSFARLGWYFALKS